MNWNMEPGPFLYVCVCVWIFFYSGSNWGRKIREGFEVARDALQYWRGLPNASLFACLPATRSATASLIRKIENPTEYIFRTPVFFTLSRNAFLLIIPPADPHRRYCRNKMRGKSNLIIFTFGILQMYKTWITKSHNQSNLNI